MQPYYQHNGVTIYHGDCRDVLPQLGPVDCVITDPVWPNALPELAGADDPAGLFAAAAAHFPRLAARAVVQLGCDSDPRILQGVPAALPYFRTCWLEYAVPGYRGRVLYSNDVAYCFGTPPPRKPGAAVIPGRCVISSRTAPRLAHPCPRRIEHVQWLVKWFANGPVLDPFMGSGTTLRAAKNLGWPAVGIEVEERYCEHAARWCEQQDTLFGVWPSEALKQTDLLWEVPV